MVQPVEDLVLSLHRLGFSSWPCNFCMPQVPPKKKKKISVHVGLERAVSSYHGSRAGCDDTRQLATLSPLG